MNDENEEMKVIKAIQVIKERQDAEDEREQDKATRDAIADANKKKTTNLSRSWISLPYKFK